MRMSDKIIPKITFILKCMILCNYNYMSQEIGVLYKGGGMKERINPNKWVLSVSLLETGKFHSLI